MTVFQEFLLNNEKVHLIEIKYIIIVVIKCLCKKKTQKLCCSCLKLTLRKSVLHPDPCDKFLIHLK